MECSCRLWPTPGMYAVTSMPLLRRTRATLRRAEFGFFGVVVYTRVQTPRRMGLPLSAGALVFETLGVRPLRTSWLIVGTLVFSVLSGVAVSGHSLVALPRRPGPEGNLHGGEGEALIVGSHTGIETYIPAV